MAKKQGITIGEIVLGLSIVFLTSCLIIPFLIAPDGRENLVLAKKDLLLLHKGIVKMEAETKKLAGNNTRDICLDDVEYPDINDCKLGLKCTDGKYPNWNGPYIKSKGVDPWGNSYYLDTDYYVGSKVARVVGSRGPNGIQEYNGGDDVIQIICLNTQVDLDNETQ